MYEHSDFLKAEDLFMHNLRHVNVKTSILISSDLAFCICTLSVRVQSSFESGYPEDGTANISPKHW